MDIKIHYCSVWNYKPRAAGLAAQIKDKTGVSAQMVSGSNGIYDVVVDDRIIFSKHKENRFPENAEILDLLK